MVALKLLLVVALAVTLLQLIPKTVAHKQLKLHALVQSSLTTVSGTLLLLLNVPARTLLSPPLVPALRSLLPARSPSRWSWWWCAPSWAPWSPLSSSPRRRQSSATTHSSSSLTSCEFVDLFYSVFVICILFDVSLLTIIEYSVVESMIESYLIRMLTIQSPYSISKMFLSHSM